MQTILINSTPESDPFNEDAAEKEKQSISKVIRPTAYSDESANPFRSKVPT